MDQLTDLAIELGLMLKQKSAKLALAESCTGGMVAQAITSVPGSSAWFDCGFVTYSNISKIEMLSVKPSTIETYGAVSEQTAAEMVRGVLIKSQAKIAASITGIAGPDGGSEEKPVGMVCFSWAINSQHVNTCTKYFKGNRQQVRLQASMWLMQNLLDNLS